MRYYRPRLQTGNLLYTDDLSLIEYILILVVVLAVFVPILIAIQFLIQFLINKHESIVKFLFSIFKLFVLMVINWLYSLPRKMINLQDKLIDLQDKLTEKNHKEKEKFLKRKAKKKQPPIL